LPWASLLPSRKLSSAAWIEIVDVAGHERRPQSPQQLDRVDDSGAAVLLVLGGRKKAQGLADVLLVHAHNPLLPRSSRSKRSTHRHDLDSTSSGTCTILQF
jgi:hypothetical protein